MLGDVEKRQLNSRRDFLRILKFLTLLYSFIYCICVKGFTLLSMMINEVLSFCLSRGHFHNGAIQKPTLKRSQESRANNWCRRSWHISIHALTFHIFSFPKMDQDPIWIFKLGWSQIATLIFFIKDIRNFIFSSFKVLIYNYWHRKLRLNDYRQKLNMVSTLQPWFH